MMCTVLPLLLSGCWDSKDIEDLSIPIVGGYDYIGGKTGEDGRRSIGIAVSAVSPIFAPDAVSSSTAGTIKAKTIGESRTKRAFSTPQKLLYGMLQASVYGEELCKQGLRSYLDIYLRNPQVKLNLFVAIAEGKAEDLLKNKTTIYSNIGDYVLDLLRNSPKDSFIPSVNLHSLASNIYSPEQNPVVPIIKSTYNSITLVGLGIFKGDRLIAKADVEEARIISFLRGEKVEGYLHFLVKKEGDVIDEGTVYVRNSRKVKVSRDEDAFAFNIDVKLKCELVEHYSTEPLSGKGNLLKEIEASIKQDVENECNKVIKKMQEEYKVDCIDITRFAMAKWRSELKDEIEQGFIEKVNIKANVNVHVFRKGELE